MASQNALNCLSCLAVLAALLPAHARAGDPPDDLAAPIPVTAPWYEPLVYNSGDAPPPQPAAAWIVYTNFDGGKMNNCGWGDNSPQNNCSTIMHDTVLPFSGDGGRRAAVVQIVRKDFAPFNMKVTDIRPQGVDYDMEMIGDWQPAPQGGFAGVAPSLDCWNENGGEVSFTLDYTGSSNGIAKAMLQELAHTWGLEHVDSKGDLLYPTTESVTDPTFKDECYGIVQLDNMGNPLPDNCVCCQQHAQFCSKNMQNSHQELLQIFGPSVPDLSAPVVEIINPGEGATVDVDFTLEVHAQDNNSPQLLKVVLDFAGPSAATTDPAYFLNPAKMMFPIKGIMPGDYTVTVTVTDEDDNQTVDLVHFTVKDQPAPSDTTTTTGATSAGTGEPDPTGSTGEPDPTAGASSSATNATGITTADPTDGATSGGQSDEDACNCRTDAAPTSSLLLLLGLLGLRRRR